MFPVYYWIALFAILVLAIFTDLGIDFRNATITSFKKSLLLSFLWFSLSILIGVAIYLHAGGIAFTEYIAAYFVELVLSIDNVFLFIFIFKYLSIEDQYQHRVLFLGVLSAIIFRLLMITLGIYAIDAFSWVFVPFGTLLIYSGYHLPKMNMNSKKNLEEKFFYRFISTFFRISHKSHNGCLFLKDHKGILITKIGLALLLIEKADILFALDSVPAVLAITNNSFIVCSSNILAMLGLRSMYFVLSNAIKRFPYLKNAIGLLLIYIGIKMVVGYWGIHIGNLLSISVIFLFISVAIMLSIFKKNKEKLL